MSTKLNIRAVLTTLVVCLVPAIALAGCTLLLQSIQGVDTEYDRGGTLYLWDSGPLTLDPAISSEMSSHLYVMQIFSGLVKFDAELLPAPDIAEKWEISTDGKTYTFYIRKDARFQDGRNVTAADVKYSWERACDPDLGSQTAATYLGDIAGVQGKLAGKSSGISGIQVIDDYIVTVTIDAPRSYFLSKLAYPTAFLVDKKNVESGGRNWWQKPNGTGPYKLQKFDEGSSIILSPNSNYYGKHASLRVVFQILSGIPMSLYETDRIDVVEINKGYIDRAADEAGPLYNQLHVFPEFSLHYLGFNCSKPPFDDPLVRQAFCRAVDRDRIIKIIQKGMDTKANGIIPPGMPGYDKDFQGFEYNPEQAKQLLARSKYGSADALPPITITLPSLGGVDMDDYLGAILQDWRNNLGVSVSVRLLESTAFHYNLQEEADEMYVLGWIADYPDPQNFLATLFATGSEYNHSHFSSPQLDELLDRASIEQNLASRLKLYQQAERLVMEQVPVMPLWFNRNYVLIKPDVKNYAIDPLGVPRLNTVTLDR